MVKITTLERWKAAQRAAKEGTLHIYTVSIGTTHGELLQIRDSRTATSNMSEMSQNNVVKSFERSSCCGRSPALPKEIIIPSAALTRWMHFTSVSLAESPKSEAKEEWIKRSPTNVIIGLRSAGILLLVAEIFFPERKTPARAVLVKRPQIERPKTGAQPPPIPAMVLLLLFLPVAVTHGSPRSAMRDYNSGNFTNAQKEFERLATEDKTGDMRLSCSMLGDAAYRATNYDAALKLFTSVLTSPDVRAFQQKAYFNIGNVQY